MFMKIKKRVGNNHGFTLIELMVVVVILGILAAVVVPRFLDQAENARDKKTRSDLSAIKSSLDIYAAENKGEYPATADDLTSALDEAGITWDGSTPLNDGWGNEYKYFIHTSSNKKFYVVSAGSDGDFSSNTIVVSEKRTPYDDSSTDFSSAPSGYTDATP